VSAFRIPQRPPGGGSAVPKTAAAGGAFATRWPALAEFLEVAELDGGSRVPGSLLLFGSEGGVKAMLKDAQSKQVCFLFGEGTTAAIDAAERVLATGEGDWRPDRPPPARRRP